MKWHEFATVFPMLGDDDLQQLADDIERNGQRFPVIVDEDGLVLDGRNRATACRMLGIEPRVEVFSGSDAEKLEYVVSLNLSRRHMDTSQRAMAANKLATLRDGVSVQKQGAQICAPSLSQDEAAKQLNVSRRMVQKARKVEHDGAQEVGQAVEQGRLSLEQAEKLVKTEPDKAKQAEAVKSGKVQEVIKRPKAETPQASPETHIEVTAVVAGRDITKVFEQGSVIVVHSQGIRKATRDDLAAATLQAHKATELIRYLVNSCPESEAAALAGHLVKAADALAPAGTSTNGKAPSVSQLKTIWRQAAEDAGVSSQLLAAVDDWAEHKQSLAGKDKVRTVKSWKTALKRILKVSQARGDAAVAEMIDKAIANGWRGWEHDNGGTAGRSDRSRVRTGDVSMEFDEVI
jgi:ParB-like chromosome segregation protein Spo0J